MTHFIIAYHISLVNVQTNYYNNNLFILDVKQLNKIMELYYFYTLKALWDAQGIIKLYYWMSRVKKQLSGKRSIAYDLYKIQLFKVRHIFQSHIYPMLFRIHVSQGEVFQCPGFSGSCSFRVQVFQGPNLSPGFKSRLKEETTREIFRTKIFENLRNFQNQTCLISFF